MEKEKAGQDGGGKEVDGRLELRKAFSRRPPRLGSLALRTPQLSALPVEYGRVDATCTRISSTLQLYGYRLTTALYASSMVNIYES